MGYWLKSGYLHRAPTLEALAGKLGIAPQWHRPWLNITTERVKGATNNSVADGRPIIGIRATRNGPNPNVAPIEHGPFYAIEVIPGSFGSFAGLRTDADARVLRGDGSPIPGLFAAGADMASIMGALSGGRHQPWPRHGVRPPRRAGRRAIGAGQRFANQPSSSPIAPHPAISMISKGRPRLRRKGSHTANPATTTAPSATGARTFNPPRRR
jgi:succinate dehydrogenase/fumarate reductase flavoprotein subunit